MLWHLSVSGLRQPQQYRLVAVKVTSPAAVAPSGTHTCHHKRRGICLWGGINAPTQSPFRTKGAERALGQTPGPLSLTLAGVYLHHPALLQNKVDGLEN